MKFIVSALLCLSLQASAQHTIGAQSFQVSVRPSLNAILNDFYQMIVLFPDVPRELVNILDNLDHYNELKMGLLQDCPRLVEKKCLPGIDALRKKLSEIDSKTIGLVGRRNLANTKYLTSLSGTRVMGDFQESLEVLRAKLDNIAFLIKADIPLRQETSPLVKRVDELSTYTSLAVVEYIPFEYKEEFRHFFFGFVHPLRLQLGKPTTYEFVNQNIRDLNFALNLLNQSLTKRNKKTPDGMAPYLATIHNRWNGILRYYY